MIKKAMCLFMAILMLALPLTACGNIEPATDFSAKAINNGYYNYRSGGKLAYHQNTLYYVAATDVLYDSVYNITESGAKKLIDDGRGVDWNIAAPCLYQLSDKLLVFSFDENYQDKGYQYRFDTKRLESIDIEQGWNDYYSEDLTVSATYDDEGYNLMTVRYRDKKPYQLHSFENFAVYKDVIYYSDHYGLYRNDPKNGDKSELLVGFDITPEQLLVCDRYCYCFGIDWTAANNQPKLYRYSFEENKKVKLFNKEILSMNTIGDHIYFAAEDGVYTDDGNECKKISDIRAIGVYIVDEEWIYLTTNDMVLYRITHDGAKTEEIKLNIEE